MIIGEEGGKPNLTKNYLDTNIIVLDASSNAKYSASV